MGCPCLLKHCWGIDDDNDDDDDVSHLTWVQNLGLLQDQYVSSLQTQEQILNPDQSLHPLS